MDFASREALEVIEEFFKGIDTSVAYTDGKLSVYFSIPTESLGKNKLNVELLEYMNTHLNQCYRVGLKPDIWMRTRLNSFTVSAIEMVVDIDEEKMEKLRAIYADIKRQREKV